MPAKKTSSQVNEEIAAKVVGPILEALKKGVKPWSQPWKGSSGMAEFPIRATGEAYRGINVVLLWMVAIERNFRSNMWMGFNTAKDLGGSVRKGEKGTLIVFNSPIITKKEEERAKKDGDKPKKIWLMKTSYVWNIDQIDGLPEKYYPKAEPVIATEADRIKRIDHADAFFKATGAVVKHGGGRAFYRQAPSDEIHMPEFASFKDAESYYATLGHEHVHWTGAEKRLNREFGKRFGDKAYAAEELVAELGSAMLCVKLGLTPEVRDDHAQYIGSWIKVLENDNKFIMQAASQASKAISFLSGEKVATDEEKTEEKVAA